MVLQTYCNEPARGGDGIRHDFSVSFLNIIDVHVDIGNLEN